MRVFDTLSPDAKQTIGENVQKIKALFLYRPVDDNEQIRNLTSREIIELTPEDSQEAVRYLLNPGTDILIVRHKEWDGQTERALEVALRKSGGGDPEAEQLQAMLSGIRRVLGYKEQKGWSTRT